jgi:homocysteine S-methyltransferase
MELPQLTGRPFVADGGLETTLVFHEGIDLPDFAAFPLLDTDAGRDALRRYYTPYLELADRLGTGIVLDTPTWRANLDWGARLGYDGDRLAEVNRRSVQFVAELAAGWPSVEAVLNGVIGPAATGTSWTPPCHPMRRPATTGCRPGPSPTPAQRCSPVSPSPTSTRA